MTNALIQKLKSSYLFFPAFVSLFLTSCAEVRTLEAVNNHQRYEVECVGKLVSMDVCYKKAAALCPRGYKVLNRNVSSHSTIYDPGMNAATMLAHSIPGVLKGLNIECK